MDALTADLARLEREEAADDAFLDWCEINDQDASDGAARRRYEIEHEIERQRAAAEWADAQEDY